MSKKLFGSPYFYFDSMSQVIMDRWFKGWVVLVGDAGHSVSISQGQGTTIAMVGSYVLAGELAAWRHDPEQALLRYETELRTYVEENQQSAYNAIATAGEPAGSSSGEGNNATDEKIPDFGLAIIPFFLKNY